MLYNNKSQLISYAKSNTTLYDCALMRKRRYMYDRVWYLFVYRPTPSISYFIRLLRKTTSLCLSYNLQTHIIYLVRRKIAVPQSIALNQLYTSSRSIMHIIDYISIPTLPPPTAFKIHFARVICIMNHVPQMQFMQLSDYDNNDGDLLRREKHICKLQHCCKTPQYNNYTEMFEAILQKINVIQLR